MSVVMADGESTPLLREVDTSHISASSARAERPQAALSRSGRASEVQADPDLAYSQASEPRLPAAAVDPSHETDLHQPRWAQHQGPANFWARWRYVWREELAEALGTSLIILFGASVECQTALHFDVNKSRPYSFGDYNSCRFAWAAGVAMAIWVSGHVSGGHCNPTVTLALWLFRGFPGRKVPWYMVAQVFGATIATLVVYANYRYSIGLYEGQGLPSAIRTVTGPHATAPMFFTFPQPWLPASSAFLSEFIASAALVCVVFALGDKASFAPKGTMSYSMFIVLIGIGASMGVNTGYALNGARDTGPRIALWLLGYGKEVWTHDSHYWIWAPWLAACAGGCFGGLTYDMMIYTGKDSFVNRPLGGRANLKYPDHVDDTERQDLV